MNLTVPLGLRVCEWEICTYSGVRKHEGNPYGTQCEIYNDLQSTVDCSTEDKIMMTKEKKIWLKSNTKGYVMMEG